MPAAVRERHRVIAGAAGVALLIGVGVWTRHGDPSLPPLPAAAAGSVVRQTRTLMGTICSASVWAEPGRAADADAAATAALDRMAQVERSVSEWLPESDTSAVNRHAGGSPQPIGADLRALLEQALAWAARTDGAFDPTGGPLFELWEAARQERRPPPDAEIERARALVGWRRVELSPAGARLALAGMKLGFGAIGKGFAADEAAVVLRARGFRNFLLDAGGDLVIGGQCGPRRWEVGLQHPRAGGTLRTIEMPEGAVATSGDYERCFEFDGVRYSHLLDLRTGRPVRGVASATAFAATGAAADALATALFVLGPERGLELIGTEPHQAALWILEDGAVHVSTHLTAQGDRLTWHP